MKILAGDIGGTKTILQIVVQDNGQFKPQAEQRFESGDYDSFDQVIETFFQNNRSTCSSIDAACIGVAGPVAGQRSQVTNLPWQLNSQALAERSGIPRFYLINDFQAVGYGIARLPQSDLITLQSGRTVPHGVRSVIGAGTGLGHAIVVWRPEINEYQVLASEAGHSSFAPVSVLQQELLQYLSGEFDCVSLERVISGPGIENIFRFVCQKYPSLLSTELAAAVTTDEVTPTVVEYALLDKDPLAVKTLELFIEAYGAAAGNLALTSMSLGGVYIAGGIAPRIASRMCEGSFIQAFNHKSKMKTVLNNIPVNIINNSKIGLLGAASFAAKGESLLF